MKIVDISSYEKLKIRPVDINNLDTIKKVNPIDIQINKIYPGYICRMNFKSNERESNIFVYVDSDRMDIVFPSYRPFSCGGWISPNDRTISGMNYVLIDDYEDCWPKNCFFAKYDIIDLWASNYSVDNIITSKYLIEFYNDHNLYDL